VTEPDFLRDTRASYNAVADGYAERFRDELAAKPVDRAMLVAFAELVTEVGGPVADVGCGPGRVTGFLDGLGLSVFGIDLSPEMIAVARRDYPSLKFDVGSMLALHLADASLGGLLAWYSTIHVPDDLVPKAFAEFHRVLKPGGYLQLGFQTGDHILHLDEALGRQISVDFHRRPPERIAEWLRDAGFDVRATLRRARDEDGEFPERDPQACVLARKPLG